jgi:NADH dehydrogenase
MRIHPPRLQVVIVGAGFGGLRVARELVGEACDVRVIDRSNHHLFQPLLYQVATAALSPADIATPIRSALRAAPNVEVTLGEVTAVDVADRRVLVGERAFAYDRLVLATGATHAYFGHDEWAADAPGLKSIADATRIRERILLAFEAAEGEPDPERRRALLNFVIVGGGPTGAELAGSIAELARYALASDFRHVNPRSTRVLLVEAGSRLMNAFPEPLSEYARRALTRLGVEVRLGARVEAVDAGGVTVNGERIASRTVLWAAGVRASAAARWLGAPADHAGRVIVQPDLTVPGHPDIFVIGDTASASSVDGQPLPGVAPVAMQQGGYVARRLRSEVRGRPIDARPFRYRDKGSMATIGRGEAVATIGRIHLRGSIAWLAWLFIHVLYLVETRNRAAVVFSWAWNYFTFQRGARLITQSGATPRAASSSAKNGERIASAWT